MHAGFEHATEDMLEAYSLGTLSAQDVEVLEEHLLICPQCQDRLTEIDEYVRHIRVAAAKLRSEGASKRAEVHRPFSGLAAWPGPIWAAAAVCCVIALIWVVSARRVPQPPAAVTLQAVRGMRDASAADAPEGQPIKLEADLTGLNIEGLLQLELVDAGGTPVQRADVKPQAGRVSVLLESGLNRGRYWVRLYGAAPARELLREYALRVE